MFKEDANSLKSNPSAQVQATTYRSDNPTSNNSMTKAHLQTPSSNAQVAAALSTRNPIKYTSKYATRCSSTNAKYSTHKSKEWLTILKFQVLKRSIAKSRGRSRLLNSRNLGRWPSNQEPKLGEACRSGSYRACSSGWPWRLAGSWRPPLSKFHSPCEEQVDTDRLSSMQTIVGSTLSRCQQVLWRRDRITANRCSSPRSPLGIQLPNSQLCSNMSKNQTQECLANTAEESSMKKLLLDTFLSVPKRRWKISWGEDDIYYNDLMF